VLIFDVVIFNISCLMLLFGCASLLCCIIMLPFGVDIWGCDLTFLFYVAVWLCFFVVMYNIMWLFGVDIWCCDLTFLFYVAVWLCFFVVLYSIMLLFGVDIWCSHSCLWRQCILHKIGGPYSQ
jgi:hypothetical protein